LFILLLPSLINADGGPGPNTEQKDGEGVHEEGPSGDRDVQINSNDGEIRIESNSRGNNGDDKFEFRLSTKDQGLGIEVQSFVGDATFRDRQRFSLYFGKIIQYSGGGDFTDRNTTVSTYSLQTASWKQFTYTQNAGKYVATAATNDGVFVVSFEFSGQPFNSGNLKLTPADLKINVGFRNFPYSGNVATDRLALSVFGKAIVGYRNLTVPSTTGRVVYTGGSAFTWVPTAVADNVTVNVNNSPITFYEVDNDGDGETKYFGINFSFEADRPTIVDWDPTVSTSAYNVASGSTIMVTTFLLLVCLLISL